MTASDLDREWNRHADSSDGSRTMDAEKASDGDAPLTETDPNEYPHGIRLVVIMISLMLSIFLVSLDNVSGYP